MKTTTLGGIRNTFAYPIGMFIIVMNEIDTMMVTAHQTIFGKGVSPSKSFIKDKMAGKIKKVQAFVKDKDPNRMRLGEVLQEVNSILWIRNALAHGFICMGGEAPSHLTLIAFGHEESFTPESLTEHVQKAMNLSHAVSETLAMITFYDLSMEREKSENDLQNKI